MKKSEALINIIKEDIDLIRYFKIKLVRLRNFDFAAYFRDLEKNFDYSVVKNSDELCDLNDEEIKINNDALNYLTEYIDTPNLKQAFIVGAKSESAKTYHTKGMYSEERVIKLLQQYRFDLSSGATPVLGDTTPEWLNQHK